MSYRKILFVLLLLVVTSATVSAQVFWTETFNNGGASVNGNTYVSANGAWTETISPSGFINDPVDDNWWYVSCQEQGGLPLNGCGIACVGLGDATMHISPNSGGNFGLGDIGAAYNAGGLCPLLGCVETDKRIESPAINCTGKSNINFKFNYITNGDPGSDFAKVWYFDGTTWNVVPGIGANPLTVTPLCGLQGQWGSISFVLPTTCNNVNGVKVGFEWINNDDGFGTDPSIAIDSIILSANSAPVALNDIGNTPVATAVALNVLVNDSDPDLGQTITLNSTIITNPLNGTLSGIGSNGSVTYTPNAGFCGVDSFQYAITDNGTPAAMDSAWVFITVGTVPVAPTPVTPTLTTVCVANPINICATPAAGATLVWSGPNSFSSSLTCINIPNAIIADSGKYCVYQYVAMGCNSPLACTIIDVNPIPNTPIVSNNGPVCTGQPCTVSANPNGSPASGSWQWVGPGGFNSVTQSATIPAVGAAQSGNYNVTHTVGGCTSMASASTVVGTIFCLTPIASFTVAPNDTICSGNSITITETSGNTPTSWSWNFNASATGGIIASIPTYNGQNPGAITFSSSLNTAATVQISLTATNALGSSVFNYSLVVLPGPPSASISASSVSICVGNTVNFTDASINSPTSWAWTFSNGTPVSSIAKNPSNIVYNVVGSHNVNLVASNMCGSTVANLSINVKAIPVPSFNLTPPFCNKQLISLFDNSSGGPTGWQWTFGVPGTGTDTSVITNPSHTYPVAGNYNIQLIVSNSCGTSAPLVLPITIDNCDPPVANFSIPNDTFCMNTPIQLTDLSTNGTNILYWAMSGANPGTSNISNPVITYSIPGTFTISLTAQNFHGSSTISKTVVILSCLAPNADFIMPASICAGQCVNITNISTEPPFTSLWAFTGSDTTASTQIDPTNICYNFPGTYTVQLQSFNFYGASNVMVKSINVLPAPRIITPNSSIVAGNSIVLQAVGTGTLVWTPKTSLNVDTGVKVISTPVNNIFYTVSDNSGCPSPDSVFISLIYENAVVVVPNAFTPDADGLNDVFRVSSNVPLNAFTMRLFNRWGEIVYHTNDYTAGWDGRYRGVEQNSGVFIYIINYQDLGDGEYKTINGNVTLIR